MVQLHKGLVLTTSVNRTLVNCRATDFASALKARFGLRNEESG